MKKEKLSTTLYSEGLTDKIILLHDTYPELRGVTAGGLVNIAWEEWVEQKTPESQFVKRVEKLEMVLQALEYETQGYESTLLDEFWENAGLYLNGSELESSFQELQKRRTGLSKKKPTA